MKYLLFLLFLLPVYPQSNPLLFNEEEETIAGSAIDLSGTNEYATVTPALINGENSLDIHGNERILAWADRNFSNKDSLGWTGAGNHSIDTSSTDKRTGSYSGKIISTAAGDSTTNYVRLPANKFTTLVNGEKYTKEFYVNARGIKGSDLVSGWNFTTWTATAGSSISDNNTFVATSAGGIYKTGFTVGTTYEIKIAGTVSDGKILTFANTGGGSFSGTFSTTHYGVQSVANLYLSVNGACTVDITTLEVRAITPPTITAKIGDQTKQLASISCIPGTFSKLVLNFQATASTINQPIKIYSNQADTIYIDDVSIRRFYPFTISTWVKTNVSGTNKTILSKMTGVGATSYGIRLMMQTNNKIYFNYMDGSTYQEMVTTGTYADNNWTLVTVSFDIDSIRFFTNTERVAVPNTMGVMNNAQNFTIGRYSYSASGFYSGYLGELQVLRGYAITQAEHLAAYYTGINMSAYQVFFPKWRGNNDTELFRDYANYQQISGSGITIADQVLATYPSK